MEDTKELQDLLRFGEDKEYYSDTEYITNSMLGFLDKSPQNLQMYLDGYRKESKAFGVGSAFHTMVLEPQKLDDEVVVFEGKTRRGKAWDEFSMDNEDKTIISTSEWNMINGMANAVYENKEAIGMINDAEKEVVEVWTDVFTGIKCKGKADMVITKGDKKIVVDLKSTKDSSLDAFRRGCWNYGYDRQAAFYMDGFNADEFWFIVVEKEAPYRLGVYKASEEFIESGRRKQRNLIDMYDRYFVKRELNLNEFYFRGEL